MSEAAAIEGTAIEGAVIESTVLGAPTPRLPLWLELYGWYGTLAILGAYAGNSFGWFGEGPIYQLLNLTGAIGVGWVCLARRTWQAFSLEVVWALIALSALVSSL